MNAITDFTLSVLLVIAYLGGMLTGYHIFRLRLKWKYEKFKKQNPPITYESIIEEARKMMNENGWHVTGVKEEKEETK